MKEKDERNLITAWKRGQKIKYNIEQENYDEESSRSKQEYEISNQKELPGSQLSNVNSHQDRIPRGP